ncbi:hypothetical protein LIA77_05918 [Sarocladium implicatum]|nr:hypothetical protein LIA77_05918 [Sarocladium implicatum]
MTHFDRRSVADCICFSLGHFSFNELSCSSEHSSARIAHDDVWFQATGYGAAPWVFVSDLRLPSWTWRETGKAPCARQPAGGVRAAPLGWAVTLNGFGLMTDSLHELLYKAGPIHHRTRFAVAPPSAQGWR